MDNAHAAAPRPRLGALAFPHDDGLVPAWRNAAAFAGPGGRIATLPDILAARAAAPAGGPAWSHWFTTASSEFYGTSPGGIAMIAVLHCTGPLAQEAGLLAAYAHEYRDRDRMRRGGRIDAATFHALLDGRHGPAATVELKPYLARREHPFGDPLTASEALDDPLFLARAGGPAIAAAYLAAHDRLDRAARHDADGPEAPTVKLEQAGDMLYAAPLGPWRPGEPAAYDPRAIEDGGVAAHLLSIGELARTATQAGIRLSCDISPHEWSHGARLVGLKPGWAPGPIHPGADYARAVAGAPELLWIPESGGDGPTGFEVLVRAGGAWFTQYPKLGVTFDTGAPRHAVTRLDPVGDEQDVEVEVRGYHALLHYDRAEVSRRAPPGANAYHLLDSGTLAPDARRHRLRVRFYRIASDRSRRLAREVEVQRDPGLAARIAEALP